MASNKKKPASDVQEEAVETTETTDAGEPEAAEGAAAETASGEPAPAEGAAAETASGEPAPADDTAPAETPASVAPTAQGNLHQRLEALELALLGTDPGKLGAVNRIAILTGTLKTALPEAIPRVGDEGVAAGLKQLLAIL